MYYSNLPMNFQLYKQYLEAEQYLESIGNMSNVNFFEGTSNPEHHFARAKYLLKLAGNPDKGLKIIHVAGTSGKGSVVNYIYNILQKAGYKVGAHFSPFISVSTEKAQINGRFISAKNFIELVEQIKPIMQKCHETFDTPSYFECWLLIALLYFKKQKCDYVVLETGCGGRYDATNAVQKTLVSVITNIGLDHMHILGNTIKQIAYEKAGIIRRRGKVFTAAQKPAALKVIQDTCDKLFADLTIVINSQKTKNQKNEKPSRLDQPINQSTNQLLAAEVAEHLEISHKDIERGIEQVNPLPARLEIIRHNPLVILDGAHNPDKLDYLAEKIKNLKFKKLHLICALGQHKKPKNCFKELIKQTDSLYTTRSLLAFRKFIDPIVVAKELKKIKQIPTQIFLDPQDALATALKKAKKNDLILITGSFFLCSDLRKNWVSEEKQLEQRTSFPK